MANTNINLLPEDLRGREEKELQKMSRRKRIDEIELSQPADKATIYSGSDKPKESFWTKIFGLAEKKKALPTPAQPTPPVKPSAAPSLVKEAEKQKFPYGGGGGQKVVAGPNISELKKTLPLARPTAQPVSADQSQPIREVKSLAQERTIVRPEIEPAKLPRPVKPKVPRVSKPDSWWNILKFMFTGRGKRRVAFKTVGEEAAVQPVIPRETLKKQLPVNKKEGKDKDRGKYHLAPKNEKTGFGVNLMPEELMVKKKLNPWEQLIIIILAVVLPLAIVYLLSIWLNIFQQDLNKQLVAAEKQNSDLQKDLALYQADKSRNLNLQSKIIALDKMFSRHLYWSNFFDLLEKYTLDGVYYTDLTADASGQVSLPAVATDYETAAKQIYVFKEQAQGDFIKNVQVDSVQLYSAPKGGIVGVSFQLKFNLQNQVLSRVNNTK